MDGKNREKKSDRTRQRLAAAAIAAMTERGYQGVTIRDICERAGVSIGSFYRSFDTKSDVLREMYETGDELMQHEDEALLARPWMERVSAFIDKYARLNTDTGLDAMRVLYNPENTWFTRVRPMQQKLEALLAGAQNAGELTAEYSASELTELFFVCMRGICYEWCISGGTYDLEQRMHHQMALLLRGFLVGQ